MGLNLQKNPCTIEIASLEAEIYPDLQVIDSIDNREIKQKDVDELQLELSLVDPQPNDSVFVQKAILFRLEHTTVRMRKEGIILAPIFISNIKINTALLMQWIISSDLQVIFLQNMKKRS